MTLKLSIEISMYPLDPDYVPPIQNFIDHLNKFDNLKIITNAMSTQVAGDYDIVSSAVNTAIKNTMSEFGTDNKKVVFVTKWLNTDLL
jgi:hypothetical protein